MIVLYSRQNQNVKGRFRRKVLGPFSCKNMTSKKRYDISIAEDSQSTVARCASSAGKRDEPCTAESEMPCRIVHSSQEKVKSVCILTVNAQQNRTITPFGFDFGSMLFLFQLLCSFTCVDCFFRLLCVSGLL